MFYRTLHFIHITEESGFSFRQGQDFFSSPKRLDRPWLGHYRTFSFPRVSQPGREAVCLNVALRLRICGGVPLLLVPLWRGA